MSRLALRISVVFVLAAFAFLRGPIAAVHADTSSDVDQDGSADSGDAVAGQVVGVASSGDTSIDATNRSEDVDVSTGDVSGSNTHDGTVNVPGAVDPEEFREDLLSALPLSSDASDEEILAFLDFFSDLSDEELETIAGLLAGEFVGADVDTSTSQSGDVGSGDAVLGQVVGVVTTRRGQADLVLSNESLDSSAESGDTDLTNTSNLTVETTAVASPK